MRWEINVPPRLEALPEPKRTRTHARQEADRLARARLYTLCPRTTAQAVLLGGAIRENRHAGAVAAAGPHVVDTRGIQPPAPCGFLLWQDPGGIGYGGNAAPICACHSGPADGGHWIAW